MKVILTALAGFFALAGTALAGDAAAAIGAQNAKWAAAFNGGDAAAVASLYTEDGNVMPPGEAAQTGRDAIAAFWQSQFDAGVVGAALTPGEVIEIDGGNAVEVASFEIFDAAGASLGTGKYVVYWRKVGDAWRMHRDIWNAGL